MTDKKSEITVKRLKAACFFALITAIASIATTAMQLYMLLLH